MLCLVSHCWAVHWRYSSFCFTSASRLLLLLLGLLGLSWFQNYHHIFQAIAWVTFGLFSCKWIDSPSGLQEDLFWVEANLYLRWYICKQSTPLRISRGESSVSAVFLLTQVWKQRMPWLFVIRWTFMHDYLTNDSHNTQCLSETVVPLPLIQFQCFLSASFKVLAVSKPLLHSDGNEGSK